MMIHANRQIMVKGNDRSRKNAGYGSTRACMCTDVNGSMFTWYDIAYIPFKVGNYGTAGL